jgi:Tfp pilus assembly protein PilW
MVAMHRTSEREGGLVHRSGPLTRTAKPALARRVAQRPDRREGGFTLVEFLISALIMSLVLSSAVALAASIQQAFQSDLDDGVVEQEARYALDWIARDLRSAGSNPYALADQMVWLDPNGGAAGDSIRVQADVNPPDGDIADVGENVTIALDTVNDVITRNDANGGAGALAMTESIFTGLQFTFLDASRTVTTVPGLVSFIQVQVTAQSRGRNFYTNEFTTSTLTTEVRLRTR